jgi:5-methylcytosine-specific restriction endonuclease McrA
VALSRKQRKGGGKMKRKRKSFSDADRAEIFLHHKGKCHLCTRRIGNKEPWEVEHVIPKAMGGTDDIENTKPAHVDCHAGKTRKDKGNIAKAKRRSVKFTGAGQRTKRPIPSRGFGKWKPNIKQLDQL